MKTLVASMQNELSKEHNCIVPNAEPALRNFQAWPAHERSPRPHLTQVNFFLSFLKE